MRWYSVKTYRPPMNLSIFVITAKGNVWVARYTGECEPADLNRPFIDLDFIFSSAENGVSIRKVTHFCIPDPVEIE